MLKFSNYIKTCVFNCNILEFDMFILEIYPNTCSLKKQLISDVHQNIIIIFFFIINMKCLNQNTIIIYRTPTTACFYCNHPKLFSFTVLSKRHNYTNL